MQTKQFWTRIYQKNIGKMIGVCCRYVGDRAVAEDLAHDAFLKAIEKSDSYRRLGSFEGWLMRITLNTTLDYLRRQPQFVPMAEDALVETVCTPSLTDNEDDMETRMTASDLSESEILDAVCSLPERHRVVFNLYVFERQSHARIAETLKISLRSSKRYLAEARVSLRASLTNILRQKKSKLMMLLPFFPRKAHAIDHLCRAKLKHLAVTPVKTSPLSSVKWASMPKANAWLALSAAKAPVIATGVVATAVTGSVIAYQVHPEGSVTDHPAPVNEQHVTAIVDTVCIPSLLDEPILDMDTMCTSYPQAKTEKHPEQQVKGTECPVSPLPQNPDTNLSMPPSSNHSLKKFKHGGFYGLADEQGKVVAYPKYSDIQPFDTYVVGWAMVSVFGLKGFVDATGREVVAPKYDEIGEFGRYCKGYALVRKGNFFGLIDSTGKEVFPLTHSLHELTK